MKRLPKITAVLLLTYMASYFALSRISLRINLHETSIPMFFYIPVSPKHVAASIRLQELHRILAYLYYPIWKLTIRFFVAR